MPSTSFADYLAGLDQARLAELLRMRSDVLLAPVPRTFEQLADRLDGAESLTTALRRINRDALVVGQAVAGIAPRATTEEISRLLATSEQVVWEVVAELCARGLAWTDHGTVRLPETVRAHWTSSIDRHRPVQTIARTVLTDDLRRTVASWDIEVDGLRKPELIDRLSEVLTDAKAVAAVVARQPQAARDRLDALRFGAGGANQGFGRRQTDPAIHTLATAGLLLVVNGRWELPREVAVATWLSELPTPLTGQPSLPTAAMPPAETLATAQLAAQDLSRAVTTVLDTAGSRPIAALKKGGVGTRERSRLATQLALPVETIELTIDLAHAAGLLGRVESRYAPTSAYAGWRESEPAYQWATLAWAWFQLEHAPTHRELDGDKEHPPPLPLASGAGHIRRALLHASSGGHSVKAAGENIDWFCPLHGYDSEHDQVGQKVAAAIREGESLGVVAADGLTEYGERLIAVPGDATDPAASLAASLETAFPESSCTLISQSDLTAIVSGQPSVRVSNLLMAAAVRETQGSASTWRFTPDSIRSALDAGWTGPGLREELAALSDQPLPQPLDYLINDVDRRHGQVRVRELRSAVLAHETTATEILHTRQLSRLQLTSLAPTVLSSPLGIDEVLAGLRAAGFAPITEDARGLVVVEGADRHEAPVPGQAMPRGPAERLGSAELADRLMAGTREDSGDDLEDSELFQELALLGPQLSGAELALLTDAIHCGRDVLITYRNKQDNRSRREIRPLELYGRWLTSWCHLRNGERDFTVSNIESVAPVGT